ncbi:MAG TPA: metalloregulator ArsR/SmtB family transcription factor [Devosia sp.]|nr:metalloregulator ArsR/SmtB family transcription factor [Devosia sp.]
MPPISQFAALADETRCRVLELLHERARPVHELAAHFAISRPAISRHLRVLKEAGLVREEKRGRENIYAMQPGVIEPATRWLQQFAPAAAEAPVFNALPPQQALALPPIADRRSMPRPRPKPPVGQPATLDLFDFAG